ncbi:MAG: metallophosphoesterase family protein [Mesorhizobium sp.]|uniref:metallophosphoesterase family protein n=1 Tax=Mesorhizobium sp. TaxID=1871066 RepID=UPI001ACBA211|nr:metallophosphoesterase family protein [Mesorhizobium sp.]MBN9221331.1 metallophosphoesterase family protein [Mesorhizobium sp.]
MSFKVGIISDTHSLLRPEAVRSLGGVDYIIHGGDIGSPDVLAALHEIAPITAIKGNVDTAEWAASYAATASVQLAGKTFYILHDLNTLQISPAALGIDVVVSGHSHMPKLDTVNGVLYLNPGSAGRRRFRMPVTLATVDITPNGVRPIIHDLIGS